MSDAEDRKQIKYLRQELATLRQFPTNTTPAARHLEMIADALSSGKPYLMLTEEPKHCAITMYAVLIGYYRNSQSVKKEQHDAS